MHEIRPIGGSVAHILVKAGASPTTTAGPYRTINTATLGRWFVFLQSANQSEDQSFLRNQYPRPTWAKFFQLSAIAVGRANNCEP